MAMGPRARHCRKRGCPCNHQTCDRGWIDGVSPDGRDVTRPCLVCREDLAVVVLPAESREELAQALADHRGDKVYAAV